MGIIERAAEIKQQTLRDQQEAEERKSRKDDQKRLKRDERYELELPAALATQRALFAELQQISLTGLIDEMIDPDELFVQQTKEEALANFEAAMKRAKKLPAVMPPSEVKKAFESVDNQRWRGGILYPKQLEDGSLDPTLHIFIDDQVLSNDLSDLYQARQLVEVAYSPRRVLSVKGQAVTFEASIDLNSPPPTALLTEVLAQALANPQRVKPIELD